MTVNAKDLPTNNLYINEIEQNNSRWDRYLGMTAAMTQVPVPTAIPAGYGKRKETNGNPRQLQEFYS